MYFHRPGNRSEIRGWGSVYGMAEISLEYPPEPKPPFKFQRCICTVKSSETGFRNPKHVPRGWHDFNGYRKIEVALTDDETGESRGEHTFKWACDIPQTGMRAIGAVGRKKSTIVAVLGEDLIILDTSLRRLIRSQVGLLNYPFQMRQMYRATIQYIFSNFYAEASRIYAYNDDLDWSKIIPREEFFAKM